MPNAHQPLHHLHSDLAVFASLQGAVNTVLCHAASHKLRPDRELSLSISVVKPFASQHASCVLSHPEHVQATPNQCLSVSIFQDFTFAICKTRIPAGRETDTSLALNKKSQTLRFRCRSPTNMQPFPHKVKVVFMLCFQDTSFIFLKHSLLCLSLQLPGFCFDESQLCQGHLSLWWSLCGFIGTGSPSTLSWPCLLTAISFSKGKQARKENKREKCWKSCISLYFCGQNWQMNSRLCQMISTNFLFS